jgi:hypothetical protein
MGVQLQFDRVVIAGEEGANASCSPEQFVSMPLHRRVQLMLEHKIEFYQGSQKLDGRTALQNFRQWSAQRAAA